MNDNVISVLENLENRYLGVITETTENARISKLISKFFRKKSKLQILHSRVKNNTIGNLANSFLAKYVYFGLYCLVLMLFCSIFESKVSIFSAELKDYLYSIIFVFNLFSFTFLLFLLINNSKSKNIKIEPTPKSPNSLIFNSFTPDP